MNFLSLFKNRKVSVRSQVMVALGLCPDRTGLSLPMLAGLEIAPDGHVQTQSSTSPWGDVSSLGGDGVISWRDLKHAVCDPASSCPWAAWHSTLSLFVVWACTECLPCQRRTYPKGRQGCKRLSIVKMPTAKGLCLTKEKEIERLKICCSDAGVMGAWA